jgi:DNA-binding PadR family transcriptional regulator
MVNNIKDTEISILGLLIESPAHGYQLNKMITELSDIGVIWRIKIANLYAILKKLENAGYLRAEITRENNRPAKNKYALTQDGRETFLQWIRSPVKRGRDFRIIFLMKLYFAYRQGVEIAWDLVSAQKEITNKWIETMDVDGGKRSDDSEFRPYVIRFRQTQMHAYQNWLRWCEEELALIEEQ